MFAQVAAQVRDYGRIQAETIPALMQARRSTWMQYRTLFYLRQAYDVAHYSAVTYLRTATAVAALGRTITGIMARYSTVMFRVEALQRDYAEAMRDTREAQRIYGAGSEEVRDAHMREVEAHERLQAAQQQSIIMYAGLLLQMPQFAVQIYNVIRAMHVLRTVTTAQTAAEVASSAVKADWIGLTYGMTAAEVSRVLALETGTAAETKQMAVQAAHIGVLGGLTTAATTAAAALAMIPGWGWAILGIGALVGYGAYVSHQRGQETRVTEEPVPSTVRVEPTDFRTAMQEIPVHVETEIDAGTLITALQAIPLEATANVVIQEPFRPREFEPLPRFEPPKIEQTRKETNVTLQVENINIREEGIGTEAWLASLRDRAVIFGEVG